MHYVPFLKVFCLNITSITAGNSLVSLSVLSNYTCITRGSLVMFLKVLSCHATLELDIDKRKNWEEPKFALCYDTDSFPGILTFLFM